jgi:DnaJ-class molecular chaperone
MNVLDHFREQRTFEDTGQKIVREVETNIATVASGEAAEFTKVLDTVKVSIAHRPQHVEFVG